MGSATGGGNPVGTVSATPGSKVHNMVPVGLESGRKGTAMLPTYTAKYTRITSGYMGQLVEWPEVITEGRTLDDCRALLQDALQEMIAAYRQLDRETPAGGGLIEQMPVEV